MSQVSEDIVLIGETNFRNRRTRFGIKTDDRRRHMYIVGKTGMGKSNLLEGMIFQDIQAGRGVAIVDPHGDLAEKVLDFVPSSRINDVIYFNPADVDFPIAFNVLEKVDSSLRHLVSSGLIGVFKKIWADSWGPRLEYLLRNSILALLDYPDSTLLGINRILTDKAYRKKVVDKLQDPVVKAFWVEEYAKYPDKFATEAIAPIQNKVGQFLSSSLIRNIVGQVKSSITMREVMDQKKILILNLSKGRIGEDNSALLGAMMITKIQLAAMSRVDIMEKERVDFYLYVDEFQNFATDSFADILSEARKYRLNLIIAHQYIEQLGEVVQPAVFGNVGTMLIFRVGAADAEFLVKEFTPYFTEEDLVNLPKYNIYLKLMIDGVASTPFSSSTLPPVNVMFGNREKIINVTRERYAKPRTVVEEKIMRWSGLEMPEKDGEEGETPYGEVAQSPDIDTTVKPAPRAATPTPAPTARVTPASEKKSEGGDRPSRPSPASRPESPRSSPPKSASGSRAPAGGDKKSKPRPEYDCSKCGKLTSVPFKPEPGRPVYCDQCFKDIKQTKKSDTKPVPIKPTEPPISLDEALKRKPIQFKGAPSKPAAEPSRVDDKPATSLEESVFAPQNPDQRAPAPKKTSVPVPENPAQPTTEAGEKKVRPGEVIKL